MEWGGACPLGLRLPLGAHVMSIFVAHFSAYACVCVCASVCPLRESLCKLFLLCNPESRKPLFHPSPRNLRAASRISARCRGTQVLRRGTCRTERKKMKEGSGEERKPP